MTVNNEEKDLLAGAFVDLPPLRVEPDQIMARRRRRPVRRTGTVAGVVLGIAAVSVVVACARVGGQVASADSTAMSVADVPAQSTGCLNAP